MEYENDIIYDAYYLINRFNEDGNEVTNMQIQKLMYFFEAYYMNMHKDVEKLYDCNFNAWAFGPVAIPLYKEFRKFGNNPIRLTNENIECGKKISKEKKDLLEIIYKFFGKLTPVQLVNLTHMDNSPWSKVWKKNGKKVGLGTETHIDKIQSRDWLKENFGKK